MSSKPKIIILGAGMSGVACALSLYNNFDVQIYEKSRGIGGRLCAKRLPQGLFHFGAQFCTAHTIAFQNFLRDSDAVNFLGSSFDVNSGSIIETKDCFVARDGMHSLLKKYNEVLNIHYNHKAIDIDEKRKLISFDSGQKVSYDIIISSLPLPQTRGIFQTEINHDATFSPCLAVGMSIDGNPYYEHNAYKNINKDAAWLGSSSFYNSKNKETWVLQFSPKTSLAMMNDSDSRIQVSAENSVRNIFNGDYEITYSGIFRWKYALCNRSNLKSKFTSIGDGSFAIGDWNISPRVESAYISGVALGEYLTGTKL
ncbi:FAD-dependent oxidoreductase [Gammaproteobacteria bacterium]|nr:FAD-dependent oxidoreductase [Gammaproteobacteria bacterium]